MKTTHVSACPGSEMVGAFVEGRSGAEERAEMIRHLDRCEPCRQEVAVLAEFAAAAGTTGRATRSGWWLAVAASLVTVAGIGLWRQGQTGDRDGLPVAPLVAAAEPLEYRLVQPRLSGGFGWAVYREPVRSSTEIHDPKVLQLRGAAGELLQKAEADPTARKTHAAAIAMLLLEDPARAIEALTRVTAERPDDARAWSDLAAARHASAIRYERDSEEPLGLAAANRAIRLDPKLPEAHFNRALILEHLGLTLEAREAWTKYLELDPSSEWAREAREHLEAVSQPTQQSQFDAQKSQLERDAAAGNTNGVRSFVDRFPQQSRATAEVETLGRWAEAIRAGKTEEAERLLITARAVGDALRARAGEELLADKVAAIDRTSGASRAQLVDAHVAYRQGRRALPDDPAAARPTLVRAAELFGSTPGALNARYFAAVASGNADDLTTAERELRELQSLTASSNYKALRALIAKDLGLDEGKLLRWPAALEQYRISEALFTELGETGNAAWMQWLTGDTLTFLGRCDDAWKAWRSALRGLSAQGQTKSLSSCLNGISRGELVAGRPDAARSLAELGLKYGAPTGQVRAEVLFGLALLNARAGNHADAVEALTEGQRVAANIRNAEIRGQTLADLEFAEGVTFSNAEPYRALDALTHAVERHRHGWRPMRLPVTLYERARVLRALGRADEAGTDLQSAIAAIEAQRKPVEWRDTESGALDGVDEIYVTLAELLLERGRTREAFAIADRAAAHAFYGPGAASSVLTLEALQQHLASGSMVVEYLVRPRKMTIFVVGSRTFEVRQIDIASGEVKRLADALDAALRNRAPLSEVTRASAAMEKTLIAPVRDLLAGTGMVTFVLDPLIGSVPLPALLDPASGRWLVEDHSIRVAASALYRDGATHEHSTRVVVIRPSAGGGVSLPRTEAEVAAILRLYPHATLLQGADTTRASVLEAIGDADMVHYAGHADSAGDAALPLRMDHDRPELLYGDDITRTQLRAAPLIVLAGCRTLRGGARRQDLATSLARAFLLAGARSVVGTTWDVDDASAATFFSRFHQLNSATGNPVTALCDAQRSMLHDERRHPAEWAFAQIVVRTVDI